LRRREVVVEIVDGVLQGGRARLPLLDESLHGGRADADECELRGDEEAVERDQEERAEQAREREGEVYHRDHRLVARWATRCCRTTVEEPPWRRACSLIRW